jgi:hypothetical protein
MTRIALAATLTALASPAFAGNVDLGSQLGLNDIEITVQTTCGTLGMSSTGGCRRGIFGLADYNAHGVCWIDRRSGRPTCER